MNQNQDLIPGLPDDVAANCLMRVNYDNFFLLASSVCCRWNQFLFSPDFLRYRCIAGITQSFYVFSFSNRFSPQPDGVGSIILFDSKSGQWHPLPPIPTNPPKPIDYTVLEAGHRIVAVGTSSSPSIVPTVHIYDLLTCRWRNGSPCPILQTHTTACASDGVRRIFVAGGSNDRFEFVRTALMYDMDDETWHRLPDMAEAREFCAGYFHDDTFYVIGGYSEFDPPMQLLTNAEQFHLSTGNWTINTEFIYLPFNNREGGGILGPYGNYYIIMRRKDGNWKLLVREGRNAWAVVCDMPSEVLQSGIYLLFVWKKGFAMFNKWDKILYLLHLHLLGEGNQNLTCEAIKWPDEYKGAKIVSGCCIEI